MAIHIITTLDSPWKRYDQSLISFLKSSGIQVKNTVVELSAIKKHTDFKKELFLIRSDNDKAKIFISSLIHHNSILINGIISLIPSSRIYLLNQANSVGIPVPDYVFSFHSTILYNNLNHLQFPLISKSINNSSFNNKVFNNDTSLFKWVIQESQDYRERIRPSFYMENYYKDYNTKKLYFIGKDVFVFNISSNKKIGITYTKSAVSNEILLKINKLINILNLEMVSIDLIESPDSNDIRLIDINVNPMFHGLPNRTELLAKFLIKKIENQNEIS